MLLEEYLQRFVGTPISTRWNLGFQYNAILAPIVALGAIEAIKRYFLNGKPLVISLLLGGVLLVQGLTHPALNDLHRKEFYDLSPQGNWNNFFPDGIGPISRYLDYLQKTGEYQLIKQQGNVYLLEKR